LNSRAGGGETKHQFLFTSNVLLWSIYILKKISRKKGKKKREAARGTIFQFDQPFRSPPVDFDENSSQRSVRITLKLGFWKRF